MSLQTKSLSSPPWTVGAVTGDARGKRMRTTRTTVSEHTFTRLLGRCADRTSSDLLPFDEEAASTLAGAGL